VRHVHVLGRLVDRHGLEVGRRRALRDVQSALHGRFSGVMQFCATNTQTLDPVVLVLIVERQHDHAGTAALLGDDRATRRREVAEVYPLGPAVTKSREYRTGEWRRALAS